MSPSGKATGFGPVIRRFESCHPSQIMKARELALLIELLVDGEGLTILPSQPNNESKRAIDNWRYYVRRKLKH